MGVPGLFAWFMKKNKYILLNDKINVTRLYLDANCMIHPICQKVVDEHPDSDLDTLEMIMIQESINYIDYIIEFVKPTEFTYIAIDGVAPFAKINQQRKRRYKSYTDNEKRKEIYDKHDIKFNDKWKSVKITPGTIFMEKLHDKLVEYSQQKKCIYSSYHENGEGEHKILQHLKKQNIPHNTRTVIYGLDADLIFLSMASGIDSIYLLREIGEFRSLNLVMKTKLVYVSIDILKETIVKQINVKKPTHAIIADFIVLSFLLGNDFLPNLPSIDIKKRGIDILLEAYQRICHDTYLVTTNKEIDYQIFQKIVHYIGKREKYFFKHIKPFYNQQKSQQICRSDKPVEIDIWNWEHLKDVQLHDMVRLGVGSSSEWKQRYYDYYFQTDNIQFICQSYWEGIEWTFLYYFKECQSWSWSYRFYQAPFATDLCNHISEIHIQSDKNVLKPFEQLLLVIPRIYFDLLPEGYQRKFKKYENEIGYMFPESWNEDCLYKDLRWQCTPLLPAIELDKIKTIFKRIRLTFDEKNRNKTYFS
jgi:5'-3' exonuclease